MGCPCELRLYAPTNEDCSHAVRECVEEIGRFESKFSRYRADSVTTAINRASGVAPTCIDEETTSILKYAEVCYEQSNGAFDITSGVFRRVWHVGRKTLPSQGEIDACLTRVGWDKVEHSDGKIYLSVPGMELDFGGVVKEYAADAAAILAKQLGIRHGLVNLGGDICIFGSQPSGEPWPIGIVHPLKANSPIATVSLLEGSLATSGGYERFMEIEGRRYSHLIDPRTGWPIDGLLSVSVVADQAIVAGSIASVALLQQQGDGLEWLERCDTPYLAVDSKLACHGHLVGRRAV
ncbi:MAG: FAD:protein FMN transferase [Gammaproteobacteria bacterium]|nr:FAD:protein FMN transferase [Gammaproteobacteria bacterium]